MADHPRERQSCYPVFDPEPAWHLAVRGSGGREERCYGAAGLQGAAPTGRKALKHW